MATKENINWKRINKGDILPCQSFLRKNDGEILKLSTVGGVKVGQDCYYLPVDEVINVIKDYPVEENEDERIRKVILKALMADEAINILVKSGIYYENVESWLEKQGEHANFRNKIQIVDKVTRNEDGILVNLSQLNRVAKKDEKRGEQKPYGLREECKDCQCNYAGECKGSCAMKRNEQNPVPKFEVGDTMRTLQEATDGMTDGMPVVVSIDEEYYHCTNELISIKDQDKYEYPPMNRKQKYAEWSEEDEKMLQNILESLRNGWRKLPTDILKYESWLKSIKARVQPKQEWSKEDERDFDVIYGIIYNSCNAEDASRLIAWLKALKDRVQC